MQLRRHHAVTQHLHGLDQAGDAGRGLQMPGAGLDRAQPADRAGCCAIDAPQHLQFGRIADGGAGPMRLDIAHATRIKPRAPERLKDQRLLRLGVGGGDALAVAVLSRRRGADQRQNAIAVRPSALQPFQHHKAAALGPHIAIGTRVKDLAGAVAGQHAELRQRHRRAGRQHQVDAADQSRVAIAAQQRPGRDMQGAQRRGTGRIDRNAGAAQVMGKADPVGRDALRGSQTGPGRKGAEIGPRADLQMRIIGGRDAQKDPRGTAAQAFAGQAGMFQRPPGHFQRQTLLRVHLGGLGIGQAEKRSIEQIDAGDKAAAAGVHPPRRGRAVGMIGLDIPARRRDCGDKVPPRQQALPEAVGIVASGKAAGHAGDRKPGIL